MIVLARWIALVLFWLLIWWELHTDRACGSSLAILTSLQDNGTLLIAKQEPRLVSNHKQQQGNDGGFEPRWPGHPGAVDQLTFSL